MGVAGGELLIPTLIFVFGADIHTAGSAVLFVSIPTVCIGLFRYDRMRLLPGRSTLLRIGVPMGIESLVGAAAGGAFAGSTSAELLKLLLGMVLVAAAFKAFWRHAPSGDGAVGLAPITKKPRWGNRSFVSRRSGVEHRLIRPN
jgi:uncharacterized membrane protein YfcA